MSYQQYVFILTLSLFAVVATPGWLALLGVPFGFGMLALVPVFALWAFVMFRVHNGVRRRLHTFTLHAWKESLGRADYVAKAASTFRGSIGGVDVEFHVGSTPYQQAVRVALWLPERVDLEERLFEVLKADVTSPTSDLLGLLDERTRTSVSRLAWTMRTLKHEPMGGLRFESDGLVEPSGSVGYGQGPSEIVAHVETVIQSVASQRAIDERLLDMASQDPDRLYRRAACRSLQERIGTEALREELETIADQIRELVCESVCEFGGPRLRQRTIAVALDDKVSLDERIDALVAVEGPGSGSTDLWQQFWSSKNLSVQAVAVKRALEVGVVPTEEAFDEALAFYRTGRPSMIRRLVELTNNPRSIRRFVEASHPVDVRAEAIRQLGRVGGREEVELIRSQIRGLVNTDIEIAASNAVDSIRARLDGESAHGLAVFEPNAAEGGLDLAAVEGEVSVVATSDEAEVLR